MLTLNDLSGIRAERRETIKSTLDSLLTAKRNALPKPIITGYSWFDCVATSDRVITFSHSHETEKYKAAMLRDLNNAGFCDLDDKIRNKGSAYFWDPKWPHRDAHSRLLPGKCIRDIRTGRINLGIYKKPLSHYEKFKDALGNLVCDDYLEWQIDIPFSTKTDLLKISRLFVRGAHGQSHWPDPHSVPLLIIGKSALVYLNEPLIRGNFGRATRFYLSENNNEINFIVNKGMAMLRASQQYEDLKQKGFGAEVCLVDLEFRAYIDSFI